MKDFCWVFVVVVCVTSCATRSGNDWEAANAVTDSSLAFVNTGNFDRQISSMLRDNPSTVTVNLLAPTTLNTIPDRLGSWLSMVEKYDGKVRMQDDSKVRTRGLFDPLSAVVAAIALYKIVGDKLMYRPVAAYNATIHYEGNGNVSKIVFTRKD